MGWIKKYFNKASVDFKLLLSLIRVIKENKLICKPVHALSEEFEVTVIRVPIIIIEINTIF